MERGFARLSEMFDHHALEEALAEVGRVPRLRVTVPYFQAASGLLRETAMLSIVPTSLAKAIKGADLLLRQPPC